MQENNLLWPNQALNQSITLWHLLLQNYLGFYIFSRIFAFIWPILLSYGVIMLVFFHWLVAINPIFDAGTKHIEFDYHYMCEKLLCKELIVCFISIPDQMADIFAKGLTSICFSKLRDNLMFHQRPISLRGHVGISNDKVSTLANDQASSNSKYK